MGSGVAIEHVYHSVLEAGLNARGTSTQFEFINFGGAGYNLQQYLAVLETKALAYNPDLILIGYCAENDHLPLPEKMFRQRYQPKSRARAPFRSFLFQYLLTRTRIPPEERMDPWLGTADQMAYVREMFARFAATSRRHQIPVVVAYLTTHQRPPAGIDSLVRASGLRFVDASAALRGRGRQYVTFFPLDPHPNARANRLFADAIEEFLLGEGLLPAK